jgi:glycosyltransferase involved in cell wall biosynthesis
MKVLHVISGMNPEGGGVCQAVRGMISGLTRLNCANEVVSLDDPQSAFLCIDSFPIHACGPGEGPWCRNPALSAWLGDNVCRFDALIIHGLWQYHSYAAWKAVKVARGTAGGRHIKLFVMTHGMLDPWFQKLSVRPFKAVRNWLFWKVVEKTVVNEADGLLFTCEQECRLARLSFRPYKPKSEHVVGLGVELPPEFNDRMPKAFQRSCHSFQAKKYFLFLSRIHPKKGVDLLIRAYSELHAKATNSNGQLDHTNKEWHRDDIPSLVIAGPGLESDYGREMQELVTNLSLSGCVYFLGMLTGDAKWGAFYGCETFVLPSHQENFGIAVVEALGCGKPVLISNQVNIWREIENAGAGVVSEDSFEGTKGILDRWMRLSYCDKEAMQRNAAICYAAHYDVNHAAERLLNALNYGASKI